jgi:hypothetical protein
MAKRRHVTNKMGRDGCWMENKRSDEDMKLKKVLALLEEVKG